MAGELLDGVFGDVGIVTTTEHHPFWNHTDQEFQRADELGAGDLLLAAARSLLTVDGIVAEPARTGTAYNLAVEEIHTYFVAIGDEEVLVHNQCGTPVLPGLIDDFGDHVVLGKSSGLEHHAAKIGGRHLMGPVDWQTEVLAAISNPNTRISVALDGLEGAGSAQSRVMAAVQRASSGQGSRLDWEFDAAVSEWPVTDGGFALGGSSLANPFG